MPANIDIDALTIFTKSRTNETEYRQKVKNSHSQLKIYRLYERKSVLRLAHFWKILQPKDLNLLLTYKLTH